MFVEAEIVQNDLPILVQNIQRKKNVIAYYL